MMKKVLIANRGEIALRIIRRAPQDTKEAHGGVDRVVEAVIAVGEEDMASHLAGERRTRGRHLFLDEGMPGAPHEGPSPEPRDLVEQHLARLDVGDDGRARLAG